MTATIKADLSDHFPIVSALQINETTQKNSRKMYLQMNALTAIFFDKLKNTLQNRNWDDIFKTEDPNKAYKYFLDVFINIHYETFP